jgi:hypothetical protein
MRSRSAPSGALAATEPRRNDREMSSDDVVRTGPNHPDYPHEARRIPKALWNDAEKAWRPTVAANETLEDVSLASWIGQALGAASMCWMPRPTGESDSVRANAISEALHEHVQSVIQGAIDGTVKAMALTDYQLLEEVRYRGLQPHSGNAKVEGDSST